MASLGYSARSEMPNHHVGVTRRGGLLRPLQFGWSRAISTFGILGRVKTPSRTPHARPMMSAYGT